MVAKSLAPILTNLFMNGDALMKRAYAVIAGAGLAAMMIAAGVAGCGGQTPADPDEARATLTLRPRRLARRPDDRGRDQTKPVHSRSRSLVDGRTQAFSLRGRRDRTATGFDLKIPVELWLEDSKGKEVREKVKYTVSTKPARTVILRRCD